MKLIHHLNCTAASYGLYRSLAIAARSKGDVEGARWYSKHARADWRTICHIAKQDAPKAHRTADNFATT